MINEEDFNYCF